MSLTTDREPVEVRDWRDNCRGEFIQTRRYVKLSHGSIQCVLPRLGRYKRECLAIRMPGDWRKVKP
jgi:hypothetical protein